MALTIGFRLIKFTASGPIDLDVLGPEFEIVLAAKRVRTDKYILSVFRSGRGFVTGNGVPRDELLDAVRAVLASQNLEIASIDEVKETFIFNAGIRISTRPFLKTKKFKKWQGSAISTKPIKYPVLSIQHRNKIIMHATDRESAIDAYYENVRGINSVLDVKWCNAVMAEIMAPKCVCLREKLDDLVLHRVFSFMV